MSEEEATLENQDLSKELENNNEDDNQEQNEIYEHSESDDNNSGGSELSMEDRARSMGWRPKDEYNGKSEHVDAETYVKNAEEDYTKNRKALSKLEQSYSKLEKTTETILAHQQREREAAEKQGYDRAMQEVDARMKKAVEDSDYEGVNEALKDRDALQSKQAPQDSDPNAAIVEAWEAQNKWFNDDPVLADAAVRKSDILAAQGKSVKEQLEGAEAYVKETFPNKFPELKREKRQAPMMNGSRSNISGGNAPKAGTYEALNKSGKKECDAFVNDMVRRGKSKDASRASFLSYASSDMFVN